MTDRLNEIEERLKAFNVTGRSQEDDPVPHWKASDEFHGNSAPDIQWLIEEVIHRDAELARLRAAGLALVEFAEDYDPENEITCCQVVGCYGGRNHRIEGSEREHAPDCPTRVFTEGVE